MKNKLLALLILTMLSLPVCVQADDDLIDEPVSIQEETVVPEYSYKPPVSKKKMAKKFLLAMGGVGASSLLIFFLLSIYNRLREGFCGNSHFTSAENSLQTPDDIDSAVKTFLNKTNWNG